jgi:hypothetical protein
MQLGLSYYGEDRIRRNKRRRRRRKRRRRRRRSVCIYEHVHILHDVT